MKNSAPKKLRRRRALLRGAPEAFTLIELLIVVLILGILAAITIPRFGNASDEAKEAVLVSNLAVMRQAIEMYRVQHLDKYPGQPSVMHFAQNLVVSSAADGSKWGPYGPYLSGGELPSNPFTGTYTLWQIQGSGPTGATAWAYSPTTGDFRANLTGNAPSGTPFWDL